MYLCFGSYFFIFAFILLTFIRPCNCSSYINIFIQHYYAKKTIIYFRPHVLKLKPNTIFRTSNIK